MLTEARREALTNLAESVNFVPAQKPNAYYVDFLKKRGGAFKYLRGGGPGKESGSSANDWVFVRSKGKDTFVVKAGTTAVMHNLAPMGFEAKALTPGTWELKYTGPKDAL